MSLKKLGLGHGMRIGSSNSISERFENLTDTQVLQELHVYNGFTVLHLCSESISSLLPIPPLEQTDLRYVARGTLLPLWSCTMLT